MKKACQIIAALLLAMKVFSQSAEELMQKSADAIEFNSMEMSATLKITDAKGSERVRQIVSAEKRFGEINKRIMKFTAPAEIKGTGIVIFDYEEKNDEMWLYLPALRKVRRIVNNEKSKSFMGSEFSNADMSKPNLSDFNHKLLDSEIINRKDCWKIESVCKNEEIAAEMGYAKKISFIEKGTNLCQQVQTFDAGNSLLKTEVLGQYKKQPDGKYFAFLITIKNEQNNRSSMFTIDRFQPGSGMKEEDFSPLMLDK